jgi:2-polyprenyl-3-methyl-5-hydroxy-6-metoxy-1,4-benzoquinol methylase
MSIASLSTSLRLTEDEIWVCNTAGDIKYPADGNAYCYELEDSSYWFGHRNDLIISDIKRFPPKGPILDVGGGNGFVTKRMITEGFEASLLEPGMVGATNTKKARQIPEVICSTFEDANFPPNSLSAVGLFDVLEHIGNDSKFLSALHTALKPNGMLYVTVPAHQYLWSESDNYAQHFRRYNWQMTKTLIENKFTFRYFTYFFTILAPAIFFLRTLPYRIMTYKQKNLLSGKSEHGLDGGMVVNLISTLLKKELGLIQHGKYLYFGTSCLWVLQKKI